MSRYCYRYLKKEMCVEKVLRFNKALKCMLRDLIDAYPEYSEFNIGLMMYKIVKTINKKLPSRFFKQIFVEKHRDNISNRDDSFFNLEIFQNSDLPLNVKLLVNKLNGLYDIWKLMDDNNKRIVWDHLNVLLQLSDALEE